MSLFHKWYLCLAVNWSGTSLPGHPQDDPLSLKPTLMSLTVCEKASLPLFLEHPRKVQRGQRIQQGQEVTGRAQMLSTPPQSVAARKGGKWLPGLGPLPRSTLSIFPHWSMVHSWLLPTVPLRTGISILLTRNSHKDQCHQTHLKWERAFTMVHL